MNKLKSSHYDIETGTSTVIIATPIGEFEGKAFLHPDDKETVSQYFGCWCAEVRATIKWLKARKSRAIAGKEALIYYYNTIKDMRGTDTRSPQASKLRRIIKEYEAEIKICKQSIHNLKTHLSNAFENRDNTLKKLQK